MVVDFAASMVLVLVSGTSMVPTFDDGDLIFRYEPNEIGHTFEDVKVGDIVVVDSGSEEVGIVTHRVIDIEEGGEDDDDDDNRYLVLKGDNNDNPIEDVDFPIYSENFRGIIAR